MSIMLLLPTEGN